jgi:hypothetical protein
MTVRKGWMQNGNVKRITIVILAVSALFGAGFCI